MATVQPFILATVTDPDSPPQTETASVDYPAANGTFTLLGGFTGSAGDYTMTGSVASMQTAIRGLTFVPTAHQVAAGKSVTTNFTVSVFDGFATADQFADDRGRHGGRHRPRSPSAACRSTTARPSGRKSTA